MMMPLDGQLRTGLVKLLPLLLDAQAERTFRYQLAFKSLFRSPADLLILLCSQTQRRW